MNRPVSNRGAIRGNIRPGAEVLRQKKAVRREIMKVGLVSVELRPVKGEVDSLEIFTIRGKDLGVVRKTSTGRWNAKAPTQHYLFAGRDVTGLCEVPAQSEKPSVSREISQ